MSTKIYHNPKCSKSRQTLQAIRDTGEEPEIVEYLKAPPSHEELAALLKKLNMRPRDLLRTKEAAYTELELGDQSKSDEDIIEAMLAHPILIERPIVVTDKGVRLCRPPERVAEIL